MSSKTFFPEMSFFSNELEALECPKMPINADMMVEISPQYMLVTTLNNT
jgi:hypothetical protein